MGPRTTVNTSPRGSRTQLVVLGGLSVVGLAVVIRLLSSGPQSAPAATVAKPPAPGAPAMAANPTQQPLAPVSVTWPTAVARDPFHSELVFPPAAPPPEPEVQPVVVHPPEPPPVDIAALAKEKIHLKATVLGDRPLAMMNGRVYLAGEEVEGFTIVEIGTNRVTLERDGSRLVVDVQ